MWRCGLMVAVLPRDLSAPPLADLATRGERLAFWINAYNDLVTEGLAALGIRQTVWELPDFFERIRVRIGGLEFSSNDIEHGVLRGNRPNPLSGAPPFSPDDPRLAHVISDLDPRIHFAINCGARSCPPVQHYDGAHIHEQLDAATRGFVSHEVTLDNERLVASPIFHWFAADFAQWSGGLVGFLTDHLEDGPVRRAVLLGGLNRVSWREYDWRLPDQAIGHLEGGR